MAHWHGLAKLRLHTDVTLNIMDAVTTDLGKKMRSFKNTTCRVFETRELPRESKARLRRQKDSNSELPIHGSLMPINDSGSSTAPSCHVTESGNRPPEAASPLQPIVSSNARSRGAARRPKTLNLNTYKHHALGDYTSTIRRYGTTDSYSTEAVCHPSRIPVVHPLILPQAELEHRNPKSRYTRTSRKGFLKQLTQIERRQARIRRIREELLTANKLPQETLASDPEVPYNIGKSQNYPVDLTPFLQAHPDDPATKVSSFTSNTMSKLIIDL